MDHPWEALAEAGVPLGAPRARSRSPVAARAVLRAAEILQTQADNTWREPLLAWLFAFQHHWPKSFERELGLAGPALRATLEASASIDENRILKLRRIAIDNLAERL